MTSVEELKEEKCGCYRCLRETGKTYCGVPITAVQMIVCPICGNKRCPKATDHRNERTNSNAPGQLGSRYYK